MPRPTRELLACWSSLGRGTKQKRWKTILACIWWTSWTERNVNVIKIDTVPPEDKVELCLTFPFLV